MPTDDVLERLDELQRARLAEYMEILLHESELFNLTSIQDPAEAWDRHVIESLRILPWLSGVHLIDVGSGGGLPGMVLAIARPDLSVTLLEATGKKARFLEQVGSRLGLKNLEVILDRAESAAQRGMPHRERFDTVTARAVAPLPVLLELTVPFAKVGGTILAIKGERAESELHTAENALRLLHVEHVETVRQPTASLVILRKRAETPLQYPRRPGEPKRRPL